MPAENTFRITLTAARRIAVARQRLTGCTAAAPTSQTLLDVVRNLGCLQLDPISAVARSHLLVLWSRVGPYDQAELDTLLWRDRSLFEYWAHAASIVLTEDYPVHHLMMKRYAKGDSGWAKRVSSWIEENAALRDAILAQLRERGALLSRQVEDIAEEKWRSTGWTNDRNVNRMLDFLWTQGVLMVAGRSGGQKVWDLAERCLPEWTPREEWSQHEVVRYAVQKSLRALGVARPREISQHYIRGRYPGLAGVLTELQKEGKIASLEVEDETGRALPGPWFVHSDDLPLLERLHADEWEPRTTLLSPFDNLICDRKRTEQLFNFYFRIEIYVPPAKRQYGYYVLPILHGDNLIGRVDPQMDRKSATLNINAVYFEPGVDLTTEIAQGIRQAIESLATFLGAKNIAYGERVPDVVH